MRRLLAIVGLALSSALLVGVPASPAAAAGAHPTNEVRVTGWMHVKDDERRKDDIRNYDLLPQSMSVTYNEPANSRNWSQCHGGEIRVAFHVLAQQIDQKRGWVHVTATGRLFEGTSCSTNDKEDMETIEFDVRPGVAVQKDLRVKTKERRSSDYADIHFTVHNALDPN
jgi:hypothetical protein